MASKLLKIGGYLVFWLPVPSNTDFNDSELPHVEGMQILYYPL